MLTAEQTPLTLQPIGILTTPFQSKYDAPRQPASSAETTVGTITLFPKMNFEQALDDVAGFEYIWVLFWFHQNANWKPKVLPPNGGRTKRGVFATRSPHRPNPIGLSLCKLLEVKGRTLRIENPDMLDGTPVLDIKPYLPHAEAFPLARGGWIAASNEQTPPPCRVVFSLNVKNRLKSLPHDEAHEIETYLRNVLSRNPYPHPYRRIKMLQDGNAVIAVKRWRFSYTIKGKSVHITHAELAGE